jgi:hypothetical protein
MSVVIFTCVHVSDLILDITGHNIPCQMGQMRLGYAIERVFWQADKAFDKLDTNHTSPKLSGKRISHMKFRLKFHSVGERDVPVPMKGLTKAV